MPALIITLAIDADSQLFFNRLRDAHFPAHANYLDAHITLFHRLPLNEPVITAALPVFALRGPMPIAVTHIRHLHNWVAYALHSEPLQALHAAMQQLFQPWLTRQDQKTLSPHITVQNKVTAYKAQLLFNELEQQFTPFSIQATGIQTWLYRKGPWKAMEQYHFIG